MYWYATRCRPCHLISIGTPTERFLQKINKTESCWLWTGGLDKLGYGVVWNGEKLKKAHRFHWELINGKVPYGMNILHECDVRNCVRIDHLRIGTQLDNIMDRCKRGRSASGEKHPRAILSENEVRLIRNSYKPRSCEFSSKELAKKFGVSKHTIHCIIYRKSWKRI